MATSFNVNYQPRPRYFYPPQRPPFQPRQSMPYRPFGYNPRPPMQHTTQSGEEIAGKRTRKSLHRKTVDYNSSVIKYLENRIWQRDYRDKHAVQPDPVFVPDLEPPSAYHHNVMNCVNSKFVRQSTNKMRCPIFCLAWTPEGRRLVTGASSGEFTLWNGLTFNFETILQAHDSAIRAMVWSHADQWMITGDHRGYLKYWQSNMNNVKMLPAHPEAIRGLSFCPSDTKFASCSDDGTVRLWDFVTCQEEKILRGHGADVKCVDWHPQKGLVASGSKDSQQPIKLWDPRSGQGLATLHFHKNTVMQLKWSPNGSWLLTASRDHTIKLFDIRNMKEELQTFKGHTKEASAIAWHPHYEGLFASGGAEGAIMFWSVGTDKEVGCVNDAHDHVIWCLNWHPMGHILVSGSNDHSTKFWTRNRPGDKMHDKYNLNIAPVGDEVGDTGDDSTPLSAFNTMPANIPGMGINAAEEAAAEETVKKSAIPGLSWSDDVRELRQIQVDHLRAKMSKTPKAKPVPKSFQDAWSSGVTVEPGTTLPTGLLGNKPPSLLNQVDHGPPNYQGPNQVRPKMGILGKQPPGGPGPRFGGPMMGPGPRMPSLLDGPASNNGAGRPVGLLGNAPNSQSDQHIPQDQDFRQMSGGGGTFHDEDLRGADTDNAAPMDVDFRDYDSRRGAGDNDDRHSGNYPMQGEHLEMPNRGRGRGMMNRGGPRGSPRGRGGFNRNWENGPQQQQMYYGGGQDADERGSMRGGFRGGRGRGGPRGGRGMRGGQRGH